jgi:hypothetical protein
LAEVNEFAVTQAAVASDYFPQWRAGFTANSAPTAARVAVLITEEAAELTSRLYAEGITAEDITDAATAAYVKCAAQVKRMVALRIYRLTTQQNPELARALRAESDAWLKELAAGGGTFLGNESLDTGASDPDGPTSHITQYGLETDVADDMSTTVPRLRRDDQL